jgi:hypothetical protein
MTIALAFTQPSAVPAEGPHHAAAATGNAAVADEALAVLHEALTGTAPYDRILLKAAAGAGKSYVLKRMVAAAVRHTDCERVAIVAFTNKQVQALAGPLGDALGQDRVCLFPAKDQVDLVPDDLFQRATVTSKTDQIPDTCQVVIATCHKLGAFGERGRQDAHLGPAANGETPYDVLFVDEAWQIPHHLFDKVRSFAPITVGVGDVGQLPPLEAGANPWRGDPGHNPFRAWPTDFDADVRTWTRELPAVWRPAAGHLGLWRAFYPEWGELNCVAARGDRTLEAPHLAGVAAEVWAQVGTGVPTLLEVDGLDEPEAPDIDLPLILFAEHLLDELFAAGFELLHAIYDDAGTPTDRPQRTKPRSRSGDPLVAILATRNQAVDDAADAVDRLRDKHSLTEHDLLSSTVDSHQGQTNGITVVIHPLTGATTLNEFNSAFGRLAVAYTRATHGLLILTRPGLDRLLAEAPARPGTPFGEPGNRQLPRQTHRRILDSLARGRLTVGPGL